MEAINIPNEVAHDSYLNLRILPVDLVVCPAAHCHIGQLRQLHDPREFFSSPDVSSSV
jgi:hypothetical protein